MSKTTTPAVKPPTKDFLKFVARKKVLTDQEQICKFILVDMTADYLTPVKAVHVYRYSTYINENIDGTYGFPMFNEEYEGTLAEMEAKLYSLVKNGI